MFIIQFIQFLKYFGKGYYFKLFNMLFLAFMTSLLDFLSVTLIIPIIVAIMNPDLLMKNPYVKELGKHFHIPTSRDLLILMGSIFIAIIIFKNFYMIFNMYWQNKIMKDWSLEVNKKFMRYFLYAPYEENLEQSNSQRIFQMTGQVEQVFDNFVFRVITFISNTIVVGMIFAWLIYLLPIYTTFAMFFFIFSASIQNNFFRIMGRNIADEKYKLTTGAFSTLMSSLSCIKDIKINGCEDYFYNVYKKIATKLVPLSEKINLIPIIPQYLIEINFVITIVIMLVGIYIQYKGSPTHIMAAYAVVAMALYRMAPLIYKSQVCINYINIFKDDLYKLFEVCDKYKKYENYMSASTKEKMSFTDYIALKNLYYSYDKNVDVLHDINLEIRKGEFIGIIGLSGAGKTTLVDTLMGLLIPKGEILVDDIPITPQNVRKFQNIVGYVSQNINTVEGTVVQNVAWGIDEKEIDQERIIQSLKQAQLFDQLITMPDGLNTKINQDGTGISQGQKQRIGIARALYRNPEIIILDEATSSLDVKVENGLAETLNSLKGTKTIIAIAHRLSTLKNCDRIIYLHEGQLVDVGTFDELSKKHPQFEEIIKLSRIKLNEETL